MARYAHQPISELLALTYKDLGMFSKAVSDLVSEENGAQSIQSGED